MTTTPEADETRQWTREDLDAAKRKRDHAELIHAAMLRGQLNELMGHPAPYQPADGQISREDLAHMTPEAIDTARREGRLDDVLGIKTHQEG